MKNQLNIPKKINVGFQKRSGTYTGLLAYVIYWDSKGKLRKEGSWESWRHKVGLKWVDGYYDNETRQYVRTETVLGEEVAPKAFDNVPTEGFVLNKGVGGQRESWGWNARNEYIRVYDPRGFEFEISVANLLFILQNTSAIKGKGLEGQFVYAWEGKDLILLPVDCYEYRASMGYMDLQTKKIVASEVKAGMGFITKKEKEVIYIGKYNWYNTYWAGNMKMLNTAKMHIFYDVKADTFYPEKGFTHLAAITNENCVDNYASLLDKFSKDNNGSIPVGLVNKPTSIGFYGNDYAQSKAYALADENGEFTLYSIETMYSNNSIWNRGVRGYIMHPVMKIKYADNNIKTTNIDSQPGSKIYQKNELELLPFQKLFVSLQNGNELELN